MQKLLILLLSTFFLAAACTCGGTQTQVSSTPDIVPGVGSRRSINQNRTKFMRKRTVQVLNDCSLKENAFVVGVTDPDKDADGRGTGVVIRSKGEVSYVVTAAHVVRHANPLIRRAFDCEIKVKQDKMVDKFQRTIPSEVIAIDVEKDMAILVVGENLGVNTKLELKPFVGEDVWAVGYPTQKLNSGYVSLSITKGTLATKFVPHGGKGKFHRTTAQIYFGNSGGGIWTKEGKLVGIVVLLFSVNNVPFEGYYYAKTINEVVGLLKKEHRYVEVFGG